MSADDPTHWSLEQRRRWAVELVVTHMQKPDAVGARWSGVSSALVIRHARDLAEFVSAGCVPELPDRSGKALVEEPEEKRLHRTFALPKDRGPVEGVEELECDPGLVGVTSASPAQAIGVVTESFSVVGKADDPAVEAAGLPKDIEHEVVGDGSNAVAGSDVGHDPSLIGGATTPMMAKDGEGGNAPPSGRAA